MPKKVRAADRLTTVSFLGFEDELTTLCDSLNDPALTKAGEAAAYARIDAICAQLYPADSKVFNPGGKIVTAAERFRVLFMRQWRSSGDLSDYVRERDRLFAQAAHKSAQKHRENLKKYNGHRQQKNIRRDMQMAEEFRKRRKPRLGDSGLKAKIGRDYGLEKSASIEAINRGLKLLATEKPTRITRVAATDLSSDSSE